MTKHVGIIGAGPVGLVSALIAARNGHRVTIFDPRSGPIDKACGEGLMPGALALLGTLGLDPDGRPLKGVAYQQGDRRVEGIFPDHPGRGVRRTTLHTMLTHAARREGVERAVDAIAGLDNDAEGVTLRTGGGDAVTVDYVLACDGLHSPTARRLGLSSPHSAGRKKRYGLRQHFRLPPWSEFIDVHYTEKAEIYITPVADDEVGVAILGEKGLSLSKALSAVPQLEERLHHASPTSQLRGAGPFPQRTNRRSSGRVLLVGDASGYVDAITGEGLRVGFEQASLAVCAITTDNPESYEASWRSATRNFRLLTSGLTALATSPLRPTIVPLARALPGVFGAIVNRLAT